MKTVFKLIDIENSHCVTRSSDCDFLFLIQRAALLGLKDAGVLNEMQYRQAEEALLRQYKEDIKAYRIEANGND